MQPRDFFFTLLLLVSASTSFIVHRAPPLARPRRAAASAAGRVPVADLPPELSDALARCNVSRLLPVQELAYRRIEEGEDAVIHAPTAEPWGGGCPALLWSAWPWFAQRFLLCLPESTSLLQALIALACAD